MIGLVLVLVLSANTTPSLARLYKFLSHLQSKTTDSTTRYGHKLEVSRTSWENKQKKPISRQSIDIRQVECFGAEGGGV